MKENKRSYIDLDKKLKAKPLRKSEIINIPMENIRELSTELSVDNRGETAVVTITFVATDENLSQLHDFYNRGTDGR